MGIPKSGTLAYPLWEAVLMEIRQLQRRLAALEELSEEARCCLLLRIVEDLAYSEIAQLLAIPEGTAMSHVHRAKATLRRRLASRATGAPVNPSAL